jgi:hypothetical protein
VTFEPLTVLNVTLLRGANQRVTFEPLTVLNVTRNPSAG